MKNDLMLNDMSDETDVHEADFVYLRIHHSAFKLRLLELSLLSPKLPTVVTLREVRPR